MAQPAFPVDSIVQVLTKDGDVCYIGEFVSCDGVRMTLRTMGPRGVRMLDNFKLAGFDLECWEELKGEVGIAFLRMMDEDDEWCDRRYFQEFSQRELEILFLEGDVRIRDDAAEWILPERLIEFILEQDNYEAACTALAHITNEEHLRFLASQPVERWDLDDDEAMVLQEIAHERYMFLRTKQLPSVENPVEDTTELKPLMFSLPLPNHKGELPPSSVEKWKRLEAQAAEETKKKPWWKFW